MDFISRADAALRRGLAARVDGASLVAFRVGFGLLAAVGAARFVARGWVAPLYVEPRIFFTWPGLGWVHPWPGWGMYAHFALMGLLGLCVAAGLHYRLAMTGYFLAFTYVELLDRSNYLNHYYLISLVSLLMILMPLGDVGSVDAWRRRRRGEAGPSPPETLPAWCLWTLRAQLGLVYFFAGVGKLEPDWLLRAEPLRTWLPARADVAVIGGLLAHPWAPWIMSWAGAAFDLTIAFFLLSPRTRLAAWLAVATFHGVTGALFNIGMFPWIMAGATLIFFDPGWPRAVWRRLGSWGEGGSQEPAHPPRAAAASGAGDGLTPAGGAAPPPRGRRWALGIFLAAWFAVQLAVPLRHLAYPGPVVWTEEGFTLSWRVMLVEKAGQVDFTVRGPDGRSWIVPPRAWLMDHQIKAMATQPDLILAFAHHLAEDFDRRGLGPVAVYADAWVSLGGRRRQRLIDPAVDLARQPVDLAPRPWILPLEDSPGQARAPAGISPR